MDRADTLRQIANLALQLEDDDLRNVIEFLGEDYRARRRRAGQQAALAFRPGDEVESVGGSRKLPEGARGHATAVRGAIVSVHFPDYGLWRVDATLLRKVSEQAQQR